MLSPGYNFVCINSVGCLYITLIMVNAAHMRKQTEVYTTKSLNYSILVLSLPICRDIHKNFAFEIPSAVYCPLSLYFNRKLCF